MWGEETESERGKQRVREREHTSSQERTDGDKERGRKTGGKEETGSGQQKEKSGEETSRERTRKSIVS